MRAFRLDSRGGEQPVRGGEIAIALEPCGGAIVLLSPEAPAVEKIELPRAIPGTVLPVRVRGRGTTPIAVEIFDATGARSDLSHAGLLRDGTYRFELPVPVNCAPGRWRVRVRETATGSTVEAATP